MIFGIQGEIGSYSYLSLLSNINENVDIYYFKNFKDVFEALHKKTINFAYLPFKNNNAGEISENYQLLNKYNFKIINSFDYQIKHSLITNKKINIKDINYVISHWQALKQCNNYLKKHNLKYQNYYDTAGSCLYIKNNNNLNIAAISNEETAKIYNLHIIEKNIQDNNNNITTFFLLQN